MSRTASKLTNSVRQAKGSQGTEQAEEPAEVTTTENSATEDSRETTKKEAPKPASRRRQAPKKSREEEPLPRMPSRRVWPD